MKIIQIKEENISKATEVMTLAFADDPIFKYIFKTKEQYLKKASWMFRTWVRWAMMFGNAAITEDGNGVVLMRPPGKSQMSFISFIRAGMLTTPVKIGWSAFIRFYFRMVTLLDKKNREVMGNISHWYGWMICTHPDHRGLGFELMKYYSAAADELQLPTYLETATERDVIYYRHYGFDVMDTALSPDGNFTLYFMVRQPGNVKKNISSIHEQLAEIIF